MSNYLSLLAEKILLIKAGSESELIDKIKNSQEIQIDSLDNQSKITFADNDYSILIDKTKNDNVLLGVILGVNIKKKNL
jgi:hypothetical protein